MGGHGHNWLLIDDVIHNMSSIVVVAVSVPNLGCCDWWYGLGMPIYNKYYYNKKCERLGMRGEGVQNLPILGEHSL